MNITCAVSSCPNALAKTGKRIKYYRFPTEEGIRSVWAVRCDRRDSWNPSTSYICSSHFTEDDYIKLDHPLNAQRLHPDAVPSKNLRLYGWDFDDAPEEETTDANADDEFIRSMIKTSARRKAGESSRAAHSRDMNAYLASSGCSEAELSGSEDISRKRRRTIPPTRAVTGEKTRRKDKFCAVLTCRAKITSGFHYFPTNRELVKKWHDALYLGEPHHRPNKGNRAVCRRHFTEDDYLDPPSSGSARRLRRGAVPSANLPICRTEVRLARLKLHLNLNRRKPEERHLSFAERLAREPELMELYREYQDEVKDIDPARLHGLPVLPANGELVGPGNPAPGDPLKAAQKEMKKLRKERRKIASKMPKEELKEERRRLKLQSKRENYHRKKEQQIADMVTQKADEQDQAHIEDKLAIVAEDFKTGAKFKVVVKKVISKHHQDSKNEEASVRALNQSQGAALFRRVISKLDVSAAKRIEFDNTDKITKLAKQQLQQKEVHGLLKEEDQCSLVTGLGAETATTSQQISEPTVIPSAIEDTPIAELDLEDGINYEDDIHTYDYDETEAITEELGGPDHCYTNKTIVEEVETPKVDPFVELQETLRSMPEEQARMLVKEKMDGYRAIFKQQVTKIRQLLRARQKTDRKFKCLTRLLCTNLREQITKYYLK